MYDPTFFELVKLDRFEKKMLIEGTRVPERFVFDINYAKRFGFIWEPKFDSPWGQMCCFNHASWPRSGRILGSEENRSNTPKIGGRVYTHIVFDELQP